MDELFFIHDLAHINSLLLLSRNFEFFKFMCEEYHLLENMTNQNKIMLLRKMTPHSSIECIEYLFYKIYPANKKIYPGKLLPKYIHDKDMKLITFTLEKFTKRNKYIISDIQRECILCNDINILQYVFEKLNIQYNNQFLNTIILYQYTLSKAKNIFNFLIEERGMKFNEENVVFLTNYNIYAKMDLIEYMLTHYEQQPVPENIIQKCIDIFRAKRMGEKLNNLKIKRLQRMYL